MMDPQEIALNAAKACPELDLFIEGDKCIFRLSYDYDSEKEDYWDTASELQFEISDRLSKEGLMLADFQYDHDTVLGEITLHPPQNTV